MSRVRIRDLEVGMRNSLVVGVVLAKQSTRTLTNNDNGHRSVAQLTLSDSPGVGVNCTFWFDSPHSASDFDLKYFVGDPVEIFDPKVNVKKAHEEKFMPYTAGDKVLVYSERHSRINKVMTSAYLIYDLHLELVRYPLKDTANNMFLLTDVHNPNRVAKGDFVDLLGAVRAVCPVRRFGENRAVREIRLFDQTCDLLKVKLWDEEWIRLTDDLVPKQDLVFLSDVRVDWDEFSKSFVVTLTKRSLLTINPADCEEDAKMLSDYALKTNFSESAVMERGIAAIDVRSVNKVCNVLALQDLMTPSMKREPLPSEFACWIYGFITKLDIDDRDISGLFMRRCTSCKSLLTPRSAVSCQNHSCECYSDPNSGCIVEQFNCRVDVTDFTGSLSNCKVESKTMEKMLECDLGEFVNMSQDERTGLKWKCLLKEAKICVAVIKTTKFKSNSSALVILDWERVTPIDLAKNTPLPPVQ